MSNQRISLIILLVLQVLAVVLYPPYFFQRAPQAIVLLPALLILQVAALVMMNVNGISLSAGRSSLVFVLGINIVVRLMMLMPNAVSAEEGGLDWFWLVSQGVAIALSVYTMGRLESRPLRSLVFKSRLDL
ncbi:MAG: hypothetical protein JXA21_00845 [Anaerolineae bacterium]|nr:hypothetical protein [Anaerolineae bacterium]